MEFLDFECEGCLAAYPLIEDLRDRYGNRVTFVVRHMPLHGNSGAAALAAEAAAEQDEFEAMYQRLFETAEQWGHQEASQEDTFFDYARRTRTRHGPLRGRLQRSRHPRAHRAEASRRPEPSECKGHRRSSSTANSSSPPASPT